MADQRGIEQELDSLHMDLMRLAYHVRIVQTQLDTAKDVLDTAKVSYAAILNHVLGTDVPVDRPKAVASNTKPMRQGDVY